MHVCDVLGEYIACHINYAYFNMHKCALECHQFLFLLFFLRLFPILLRCSQSLSETISIIIWSEWWNEIESTCITQNALIIIIKNYRWNKFSSNFEKREQWKWSALRLHQRRLGSEKNCNKSADMNGAKNERRWWAHFAYYDGVDCWAIVGN